MPIKYIKDASVNEILEFSSGQLHSLSNKAMRVKNIADDLRTLSAPNDARVGLLVAELIKGLHNEVEQLQERIVVDLMTMYEPKRPPVNEIARSAGVSVTLANAMLKRAEELPEEDD